MTTETKTGLRNPAAANAPMVHFTKPGPILMVKTAPRGLGEERASGNNKPLAANGKRMRLPNLAAVDIENPDTIHPDARRGRFEFRVDSTGRVMPYVVSCGAAHLVNTRGRFVTDAHARERLSKAWALAWFSVEDDAKCLLTQIAEGECNRRRIVDRSILADAPCVGPCKHFDLEKAARAAKNAEKMEALETATRREDPAIAIARGVATALRAERDESDAPKKRSR